MLSIRDRLFGSRFLCRSTHMSRVFCREFSKTDEFVCVLMTVLCVYRLADMNECATLIFENYAYVSLSYTLPCRQNRLLISV
jgi:hypothetical protein